MKMACTFFKFNLIMKRVILCLALGLAFHFSAFAQPSIIISDDSPMSGDDFILDVSVADFTQLLSTEFTLRWDETQIDFQQVLIPGNLPDLDIGDFDVTNSADGYITLQWAAGEDPDACSDINSVGVDLPDGTIIFSLEFEAIGAYGDFTEVRIDNDPVPIRVTRKFSPNPSCNNIQINESGSLPGLVSIGVRPFNIVATNETANEGEVVCVDFPVTGWDNLSLAQFSVAWDPALLSFNQVIPSEDITNLSQESFNPGTGTLAVAWFYSVPNGDGITVPDSTVMFTACFDVLAPCETDVEIVFQDEPTDIEVRNADELNFEMTVLTNPGEVSVNDCAPTGLQLNVDCGGPFELNNEFCVPVRAGDNFIDVSDMAFQMKWAPGILSYTGTQNENGEFTPALIFNEANTENGVLGVSWESAVSIFNADLDPNDILFEVCFEVVGVAGDSPFSIPTTQDTVRIDNGGNIGVNPTNCLIDITPPAGVILNIPASGAPLGDNFCADVTVSNFTDITEFQVSFNWDFSNFSFTGFSNLSLPGASTIDLGADGIFAIDWDSGGNALDLTDGDVLVTLCFDAVGPAFTCDQASIVGIPLEAEAVSSTSNGNNIGVSAQIGDWCIQSPNGYFLEIPDSTVAVNDTICVPIQVNGFTDIVSTSFCINFDSEGLEWVDLGTVFDIPGLDAANITISEDVGLICVDWTDISGVTVPDASVMMELCFQAIGDANTCEDLTVNSNAMVETLAGSGSVIPNEGEICIEDRIIITDVRITDVDCPGNANGRIEIDYEGGSNNGMNVVFNWPGLVPQQFGDTIQNLAPGTYTVNYFDTNNPDVGGTATFTVGVLPGAPVADAGMDQKRLCCPLINILDGTGSSTGPEYEYRWFFGIPTVDALNDPNNPDNILNGTQGGNNINLAPNCEVVQDSSVFVLQVTNTITGCVARDIVYILPADYPTADAGMDQSFNCDATEITFTGSGSAPNGENVTYAWDIDTLVLVGGGLDMPSVSVDGLDAGELILTVTNEANNCTAQDTVALLEEGGFPIANIGSDTVFVGCGGTVTLDGSSDNQMGVTYAWSGPEGNANTPQIDVSSPGTYMLTVTNNATNCESTDMVVVEANADFPEVAITNGMEGNVFNCANEGDTLSLAATLSNVANFNFTWAASNGGVIVPSTINTLTPQITAAGDYAITVTNTLNGCQTIQTITVGEDFETPQAIAASADTLLINCTNDSYMLDGMGSTTGDVTYVWSDTGGMVIPGEMITVTEQGTYFLEVTNNENGCFAMDSVVIDTSFLTPELTVATPPDISCSADSVILVSSIEDIEGTVLVQWTTNDPVMIENADQFEATVFEQGTFTVEVTLAQTGCSVSETVSVGVDDTVPIAEAGEPQLITCEVNVANLDGTASSTGDRFVYQWTTEDGQLPPNTDTITTFTSTPGTYVLMVTDTILGCSTTDTVMIDRNIEIPNVSVGANGVLDCATDSYNFNTSLTDMGDEFTYEWVSVDDPDNPISTDINFTFTTAGEYALIVRNTETGCVGTDFGNITDISADDPVVTFASDTETLDCITDEVTFTASVSPDTVDYTYQWFNAADDTPLMGETDTTLTVSTPGDYYFIATNVENQCAVDTAVAIVTAENDQIAPVASFAQDTFNITCLVDSVGIITTGTSMGAQFSYQWNQIGVNQGEADIENISNDVEFGAPYSGTFEFIVTNNENGCVDVDTAVIARNYEAPNPIISPVQDTFFCQTESVMLDGSTSTFEGNNASFEWLSLASEMIISENQTAQILGPGGYQLTIITNEDVDECRASTNVFVEGLLEAPEVMVPPVDSFDCFTTVVSLEATVMSDDTYTTTWTDLETTGIISTMDNAGIQDTGMVELLVTTNPELDGCTFRDTFEIGISLEEPILEFEPIDTITCDLTEVNLTITNVNANVVQNTVWDGPGLVTPFPLTAIVNEAGTYEVTTTIENSVIGECDAIGTIEVSADTIAPEIMVAAFQALDCANVEELLDVSGSTFEADNTIQWTQDGDALPDFDGQTMVTATEGGQYEVTIENNENGCFETFAIELDQDTMAPILTFEMPDTFNCSMAPVTLDASSSGDAADFSTITWTADNGQTPTPANQLITEAPAGGNYTLTVVSASNSCEGEVMVTVEEDTMLPEVEASSGMDNIGCSGDPASIGGTATSTGSEFTYQWNTLNGTGTVADANSVSTTASDAGTYELVVTNVVNECIATDTVIIEQIIDLDEAQLEPDTTICEMDYALTANLPQGASGTWTSSTGTILDPADPNTMVMDLETGDNVFTWTLTAPGCEDYSTASVVITVPDAPTANNDIVDLTEEEDNKVILAAANDLIGGNFSFDITTQPTLGQVDSIDAATGTIYFSIKPGQFGDTEMVYKICDEDCVTLCDEATIQISIERRAFDVNIPNGITMNDDGVNDALVFDQLLNNPEAYENNELIIFNRWGDIVYEAKPYNNDWMGQNLDGTDLPEGTYYFILRLNIPTGEIIRGDVTIVK